MNRPKGVLVGRALTRFLLLVILIRLVRDTSVRMMFPFIPAYAQGLGITLTAVGLLLMVRTIFVALAPVFGNQADRIGNRPLLILGFTLQSVGLMAFSFSQGMMTALIAVVVLGIADALILPLIQAYVGEHSPAHQRGRSLVTVEYSWAITGIMLLPIVGWLIAEAGWQMPFRVLSLASLGAVLLLVFLLPADVRRQSTKPLSLKKQAGVIIRNRSALGALLTNATVFIAAESFFVVWGAHLTASFALGPVEIGRVASVFGMAELIGSILASIVIERVGKRHSVIGGVLFLLATFAILPWLNQALVPLIVGLSLISIFFEFTIVNLIPLMSEQLPGSRATMLALGAMLGAMTRGMTDPVVTSLLENVGFLSTIAYASVALAAALMFLWRMVKEPAK